MVKINAETIKKAIDNYVPKEKQDKFFELTGTYLESNVSTFFNAVIFDYSKLIVPKAKNESINDYLQVTYGDEFMELFKWLTKNPYNAIGVIL